MATQTFSANSAYRLEATASRSGTTVTVTTKVTKTSGTGYQGFDSNYLYRTIIDGTTYNDTWGPYNFTGSTPKTLTVGSKAKAGLAPGSRSWSVTVTLDPSLGTATVSGSITIPYDVPDAPTIQDPLRNSDTSHTVRWARNATVAGRYQSQQVQRALYNNGWSAYVTVVTLGTDYTNSGNMSHVDTGTVANRAYRYRVVASNSAGSATSGVAGVVYTTPDRPASLTPVKLSNGNIQLTLDPTTMTSNFRAVLEYSTNNGSSWSALTTLARGATQYTWASVPAGSSVKFRVRVYIDASDAVLGNGLTSGWRESVNVPLLSPPNAPSNLSPNGVAYDADGARTFSWRHNSVDTSSQEAYEIQYRKVGAGSWTTTGKQTSTTQSRSFAGATFENGFNYEWQVRTWGAHASPSSYSATAIFTASAPPSATIDSPSGTLDASLATVSWTYYDPDSTAQSAWEAQLLLNGTVLEQYSGSGWETTSKAFTTRLEDDTEYSVQVRVRDGSSLWSDWAESFFTTSFPLPPSPSFTLDWDEQQGAVLLTITNPDPAGDEIYAVHNQVFRSYDDGDSWELALDNAPLNTTIADREVVLGDAVHYQVVAWSDLPSSSEPTVEPFQVPGVMGYWSGGDGLSVAVQMKTGFQGPPAIDLETGLASREVHYFAGRRLPVEFAGQAVNRSGQVRFLVMTVDEKRLIEQLSLQPAPHLFRLPDGTHIYASIGPVSLVRIQRHSYTVELPIQEVSR